MGKSLRTLATSKDELLPSSFILVPSSFNSTVLLVMATQICNPQVLRQVVLLGHEVFEVPPHRLHADSAGDVGSEGVGQQRAGGVGRDPAAADVEHHLF